MRSIRVPIQTCYDEKLLGLTVVMTEPGLFETRRCIVIYDYFGLTGG